MSNSQAADSRDPRTITRPDASLLRYYVLVAALSNVAFPFVMLPLYFRYHTLRYRFDDDGVSMSWGVIFHRQIFLTYRRIQDIHVTQNVVERWMGLAKVHVQTASGTSGATMTIEGLRDAEPLRDFLYARMRGARGETDGAADGAAASGATAGDEALGLLHEIRDALHTLRRGDEAAS